jgi:hypothetical protein
MTPGLTGGARIRLPGTSGARWCDGHGADGKSSKKHAARRGVLQIV